MHVFIDTNILLNFFHFTKDELNSLNDVFASHEHGATVVYLTQQVCDEFKRNRETRIKDAIKRFTDISFSAQLPSFMKDYEEYSEINQLSRLLRDKQKSIMKKAEKDIVEQNLTADKLIGAIFNRSKAIEVSDMAYSAARKRMALGNPPGKNNSIGDSVNWLILLDSVPQKKDLHIISEDGDFYSAIKEEMVHPFLKEEWNSKKQSSLFVYRTLSEFMKKNFDGVDFSFDQNKQSLIDGLMNSGSFSSTHNLIAQLESYAHFTLNEVKKILDAAMENNQFEWIITDYDVSDFLNRVAIPHIANIDNEEHKSILKSVINEREERQQLTEN